MQAIAAAANNLVELRDRWLNPPDTELRKRTLTNLYNEMKAGKSSGLTTRTRTLDHAVFAAYGWPRTSPTSNSSNACWP